MACKTFIDNRLEAISAQLGDTALTRETLETLEAMAPDEVNKPRLSQWLQEGLTLNEQRWEIRTALRCLARTIQPRSYLEIGTRRGWSLAQVLAEAPDVRAYALDMWISGYGDVSNPGPEFVRTEMQQVAPDYKGNLTFLTGNSHDLLPIFLDGADPGEEFPGYLELVRHAENRPHQFDLVTVDGDHTAWGAWWDLIDILPHVALGGAVVFDDLLDTSDEQLGDQAVSRFANWRPPLTNFKPSLKDVWLRIQRIFGNFVFIDNPSGSPPIGIAVRVR